MTAKPQTLALKVAAHALLALPLAVTVFQLWRGTLGVEPVAIALNRLGLWTLTFLLVSLACTPAKLVFGLNWPNKLRRLIGLWAFAYGVLHFAVYVGVDQGLDWGGLVKDVVKRKFMTVGFAALVLLVPLAITSTNASVKRLGFKRWKAIHRLVYVSASLGVVHFIWRVKADYRQPLLFAFALSVLFAVRLVDAALSWRARRAKASPASAPRSA